MSLKMTDLVPGRLAVFPESVTKHPVEIWLAARYVVVYPDLVGSEIIRIKSLHLIQVIRESCQHLIQVSKRIGRPKYYGRFS